MTHLEKQGKQDPARQELYDKIRRMSAEEGKLDSEISAVLKMDCKLIYHIRRNILKISNYGRKRICEGCHQQRSITLFNLKESNFCIICRRKEGNYKREKKKRGPRKKEEETMLVLCLSCEKSFESRIYPDKSYDRVCPNCKIVNDFLDRVSI